MKNQIVKDVIPFAADRSLKGILSLTNGQHHSSAKFRRSNSVISKMIGLGERVDSFTQGIREHVRIGSKISETVKGKLSLGAKILQVGGVKKVFKQNFSVKEGEKLLKVSQCYLSTTAGPLAGLLFISTEKIAFCSERSIKISTTNGEFLRAHYKVVIPLEKIEKARESENVKQPSRKYIELVTKDNFEFWFMGFFNYRRTIDYIQHTLSSSSMISGF